MKKNQKRLGDILPSSSKLNCNKLFKQKYKEADRFIPNRSSTFTNYPDYHFGSNDWDDERPYVEQKSLLFERVVKEQIFGKTTKVLQYGPITEVSDCMTTIVLPRRVLRDLPDLPDRILDAPDIIDDYYLNLLSWSCDNILAVALGPTVYLWNAVTGDIDELMNLPNDDDYVSSVKWAQQGQYIAIGTSGGSVHIWDADAKKRLRDMPGHSERVSSLSWNRQIVSSGARDYTIVNHEVSMVNPIVSIINGHEGEVCSLAWNRDGKLLASGSNDNNFHVRDIRHLLGDPLMKCTEHKAAVKGLAWKPDATGILASGGGTADRTVKIWNCDTGAKLGEMDTGSQVCGILWSQHYPTEILTSHGYSYNQLCLWNVNTLEKLKEFRGHSARVLYMDINPDGTTVVSGAGDETLRFWKIFHNTKEEETNSRFFSKVSRRSLSYLNTLR